MDYRSLIFYQKAQEVVKGVNIEIKQWPKTLQAQIISRQLILASTSIGANIAECEPLSPYSPDPNFIFEDKGNS